MPKSDGADITISLKLEPDDKGQLFGIKMLGNHSLKISLKPEAIIDIRGAKYIEVGSRVQATATIDVKLVPKSKIIEGMDYKKGSLTIEQRKEYLDSLRKVTKDLGSGTIDLLYLPISMPGKGILNVGIDLALEIDMSIAIEAASQIKNTYTILVGVVYDNGSFSPYTNTANIGSDKLLSIVGKGKVKAGFSAELKANVVNEKIAQVSAKIGAGGYVEGFLIWPVLKPEEIKENNPQSLYLYGELRLYIDYSLKAGLAKNKKTGEYRVGFSKSDDLWKKPLLAIGNKEIPYDIEVLPAKTKVQNGKVVMPDFKFYYYDVSTTEYGIKVVEPNDSKLKFMVQENSGLRLENGMIVEDGSQPSVSEAYVVVTYKPTTIGDSYSGTFSVILNDGVLEGTVYTYGVSI